MGINDFTHKLYANVVKETPGNATLITPPQLQIAMESLFKIGIFFIITVGLSGNHGDTVSGMHGIGVSTPSAAAVAAITIGFAILIHIPKGIMLSIGMWSIIVAPGRFINSVILVGNTMNGPGAAPNEH
jgi:hypothetical protein